MLMDILILWCLVLSDGACRSAWNYIYNEVGSKLQLICTVNRFSKSGRKPTEVSSPNIPPAKILEFSKDRETARQWDRVWDLSKIKHLGPDYEAFTEVVEHLHVKSHWLQLLISMRKGCTVRPLVRE